MLIVNDYFPGFHILLRALFQLREELPTSNFTSVFIIEIIVKFLLVSLIVTLNN